MKRSTFYKCDQCGTIVVKAVDGGGELCCCKQPLRELVANTTDAATEKHVPVVEVANGKVIVNVGSVDHPMLDEHFIQWVYVVTDQGVLAQCLKPGDKPHAEIELGAQTPLEVYEYCNIHGLWKTEL